MKKIVLFFIGLIGICSIGSNALAASETIYLPIPPGYPTLLGVSCGGVQVTAYITGFDVNDNVTGELVATTRCGGSGRGGGYKSTTYTSTNSVTWDWFGNYTVLPYDNGSLNANYIAVDQYGNTASVVNGVPQLVGVPPTTAVPLLTIIPNVVGMSSKLASAAITAAGLVPVISYYTYPTKQPNTVLNVIPAVGTGVAPGSEVTIIVRRNPN